MINPASGFWPIFGPLGPSGGPGSPGNGPGLKNSVGCTKNQAPGINSKPHSWAFYVFGTDREKANIEMINLRPLRSAQLA